MVARDSKHTIAVLAICPIDSGQSNLTESKGTKTRFSPMISAISKQCRDARMPAVDSASNKRGRVLHVINGEDYSGAERVQDELAMRLPDFGYDVGFACVLPGRFDSVRQAQHIPLENAGMRSKFDLRPVRQIERLIRDGQYDIVHTHTPRSLLIGGMAANRAGVPTVHHVQCPAAADTTNVWRNRLNAFIERRCMKGVARVLPVSESLREYLHGQGVKDEDIRVVPNAVPVHGPLADRPTPEAPWTIGICAMFRPRKGLDVLIDSLAKLKAAGHNVRLRAVGYFKEPQYKVRIEQQIKDFQLQEIVDWRGFSDSVYDELAQMDLFVLPSLFGEGMPLAILEAMAAGVPVVSTRVEGTPELVRDGIDGVIVEPGDAVALAGAFERIIRGELNWQELRASAHQRQGELFSDTKLADSVAAIYSEILER